MTQSRRWSLIYLLLFLAMLAVNYLSSMNVGNVANNNQALIQPAGYAFSIWGLIYLLLFIWIIRLFMVKRTSGSQTDNLTFWPALNFILNGLWIYVFTNASKLMSVVVIIGLLITLVVIYRKIYVHHNHPFDRFVFSIYFSWVTVATIVNIFTWVKSTNVKTVLGLSELNWTNIMLVVGVLLAIYIAFKYKDFVYPLVFIWAYTAIYLEDSRPVVLIPAIIGLALAAAVVALRTMKNRL